jgi:ADP-dependent NAD(P)H-hydrate dehydratase / NAD(P)H-hydrate epimerase
LKTINLDIEHIKNIYKPRDPYSHKGDHGHALIIGGATGKIGAAILATEACLRSGAGLTTVHLLSGDNSAINTRCPEAMTIAGDELVKKNLSKYTAIGIGPGLGRDDIAFHLVSLVIEHYSGNIVLDADALNILSQNKNWLNQLSANTVLTPHAKEFDRLFGDHANEKSRQETALQKSKQFHCVIIMKGHHSLVAFNGKAYFNTTGNSGLAKGGSGDALTGIIISLLAQNYSVLDASKLGVFIHGLAADIAIQQESNESLLSTDVSKHLGQAFKKLSIVS